MVSDNPTTREPRQSQSQGKISGSNVQYRLDDHEALLQLARAERDHDNHFVQYRDGYVDLCGRWLMLWKARRCSAASILYILASILPTAPYLAVFVDEFFRSLVSSDGGAEGADRVWKGLISSEPEVLFTGLDDHNLEKILLTALRLISYDNVAYASAFLLANLPLLLKHRSRTVRYLTIAILRSRLHAADKYMQSMVQRHVGSEPILGQWDQRKAFDYQFLPLWEEQRLENLKHSAHAQLSSVSQTDRVRGPIVKADHTGKLSDYTINIHGCLLPSLSRSSSKPSTLVQCPTTNSNLSKLAQALLLPTPILVTGLAGSGKTSAITHIANELGKESKMLTLHLNEQTDAKLLVGMYSTADTPGSFSWRAGVLTTAVREGRWVLIEDLDRAPAETLSVILPLLERRVLLIPSRGEVIRAARGFRLIATMRTHLNSRGDESTPDLRMLGSRLWRTVPVSSPDQSELAAIILEKAPVLRALLPSLMNVFARVKHLYADPGFTTKSRSTSSRPLTPRDLFRWCRRVEALHLAMNAKTGFEPVSDTLGNNIFMEAVDCLAGCLQAGDARAIVSRCIGEEMHLSPQRVDYMCRAYVPRFTASGRTCKIGRCLLPRQRPVKTTERLFPPSSKPFAATNHTLRLMEQIGMAIQMSEPILLVGETGIGKTAVIQHLAEVVGQTLTTINLSRQSESGDLLGGFKPVDVLSLAIPMKEEFDALFSRTFSAKKNQRYMAMLNKSIANGQWKRALVLWTEALKMVESHFAAQQATMMARENVEAEQPSKKRRLDPSTQPELRRRWDRFADDVQGLSRQLASGPKGFAFKFVEGNIIKAVRNGGWVLLDEINLASSDTLESIADLLQDGKDGQPSILLSETGDIERIRAHPDFRVFGAMNPATDVGKKDLPIGLRSRFTEIYVESPDRDLDDLIPIVKVYLQTFNDADERAASDVAQLYLDVKKLAVENRLVDGANQRPHYSLRTLTRTLAYVSEVAGTYGLRRALYEGFSMSFLTLLDRASETLVVPLIDQHLLGRHQNVRSLMSQVPRPPTDGKEYVKFEQYWMAKGEFAIEEQPHYIITPFVRRNMLNLIRATSTRRFPVLIQGPTSSGKTSMIEYLAKMTGNKFVRINNHEHTDLQEYLGTYVSGHDGKLVFREGVLVQALREGHFVVLDELNLAPTDVLEALNRLLDDNRELLIPETQTIVRPHPNFMLFATQNPAGLYGGRKVLSRAFRNRFLELHFDDIPDDELETILRERTQIAPSFCAKIVAVYQELSRLRQSDRVFEQRNSFATLRDLFRWALRDADNREQLAINGYMLLVERVRKPEDRLEVKRVIEKIMKVHVDEDSLFSAANTMLPTPSAGAGDSGIVWTRAMRRLFILVSNAIKNNEPVLLVGETGCGKTSVCQVLATAMGRILNTVNAHQNTETGDLIGAQRPVRNRAGVEGQLFRDLQSIATQHPRLPRSSEEEDDIHGLLEMFDALSASEKDDLPPDLCRRISLNRIKAQALFQWSDGALVQAMREGQFFLLDEISLADDAVLERLNSVLEPQRSLLLAEKGPDDSYVEARPGFQFLATMNPGGEYGKRELSLALRNRFTEIWVPPVTEIDDVFQIAAAKLTPSSRGLAEVIVRFAHWFGETFTISSSSSISIRDILAWVSFINSSSSPDPYFAVVQGAAMVFIDTLGANPAAMLAIAPENISEERRKCLTKLNELLEKDIADEYFQPPTLSRADGVLSVGRFSIPAAQRAGVDHTFAMEAPTTISNAMRLVRALQVRKPVLLEGSPGVGKTTLVAALARAAGKPLTRINLSDQTDLMDLFGSDVPVEGAEAGNFEWRDAAFLRAMQKGEWVLLDEMNLASQSVLEGLNACLDHRGQVYISELDQTFTQHPDFVVFAAQNPHHQGGGRKGLPSSFVNRFTVVFADNFTHEDLMLICQHQFPDFPQSDLQSLLAFVTNLEEQVVRRKLFGALGGPWEFNLRDTLRWLQLLTSQEGMFPGARASDFLSVVFSQRFRTVEDRLRVRSIFEACRSSDQPNHQLFHNLTPTTFQAGFGLLQRSQTIQPVSAPDFSGFTDRLPVMESLTICIQQRWPAILVGAAGCGKSHIIQYLASLAGAEMVEFALNPDIDTMDLVGGYEQVDVRRRNAAFRDQLERLVRAKVIIEGTVEDETPGIYHLLTLLQSQTDDRSVYQAIHDQLAALVDRQPETHWVEALQQSRQILDEKDTMDKASFEWVDGVLIKALERGSWLVLDNANLCSASVLDRLNSLLEPDGVLTVHEHRTSTGIVKVVTPHPDCRIFLTLDPKNGELSRAMRNRAVEIFMEPLPQPALRDMAVTASSMTATESQSSRFRALRILKAPDQSDVIFDQLAEYALTSLSPADFDLLPRWKKMAGDGLLGLCEDRDRVLMSVALRVDGLYRTLMQSPNLAIDYSPLESWDAQWQPLHPLNNVPLAQVCARRSISGLSIHRFLAMKHEVILLGFQLKQRYDGFATEAKSMRTVDMSRFHRSLAARRIQDIDEDSTRYIAPFVEMVLRHLIYWSPQNDDWSPNSQEVRLSHDGENDLMTSLQQTHRFFEQLTALWHSTVDIASKSCFDEGPFQAHLELWNDLLKTVEGKPHGLGEFCLTLKEGLDHFASRWRLSSGLSMERLWKVFRPITPTTLPHLQTVSRMQSLASRFDTVAWTCAAPLEDIADLRRSIGEAVQTIRSRVEDDSTLLDGLEGVITSLEAKFDDAPSDRTPYFQREFETLCQHYDLLPWTLNDSIVGDTTVLDLRVPLLAQREIIQARSTSTAASAPSRLLDDLSCYVGVSSTQPRHLAALRGRLVPSIIQKVNNLGEVSIGQLDLLIAETEILARVAALSVRVTTINQVELLSHCLRRLVSFVLQAHDDLRELSDADKLPSLARSDGSLAHGPIDVVDVAKFAESVPQKHHFSKTCSALHQIMQDLDLASVDETGHAAASSAWKSFASVALELFVPNRAFDPALKPTVECEMYRSRQQTLQVKLSAAQLFEQSFMGQRHSLRTQLLEERLIGLGTEPQPPPVVRPARSDLGAIQGEFSNLLTSVLGPCLEHLGGQSASEEGAMIHSKRLLNANLTRVISRLLESDATYDDITVPVVGFLRCLEIGLTLSEMHTSSTTGQVRDSYMDVCNETPLLCESREALFGGVLNQLDRPEDATRAGRRRYIKWIATVRRVEPKILDSAETSEKLWHVFHDVYVSWRAQLETDQEAMVAKHGLYRYRGGEEDLAEVDENELQELFPTYDSTTTTEESHSSAAPSPKDTAIEMSSLHREIFLGADSPPEQLIALIREATAGLSLPSAQSQRIMTPATTKCLFPAMILSLDEANAKLRAIQPSSDQYSFYLDSHLAEAKKLVSLVKRIQIRFQQLQETWPEHATLADVLRVSDDLLALQHIEPVAKFLTRAEKLHEYMYEWQTVASREFTAIEVYNDLTSLLVSWRRLELSTWGRLFDMESAKCEQDAASWWFIAYENIIAMPISLHEGGADINAHAVELLSALERFFATTTLGQYGERLRMLRQFREQLRLATPDLDFLCTIERALTNFVDFYSPFEAVIKERLMKGRQTLEKDMREVVLLASWKDTNINALRDSAKKSHQKLFKIVRKYRDLLGQPVDAVIKQGLPEGTESAEKRSQLVTESAKPVDALAFSVCEEHLATWPDRAPRFIHLSNTTDAMIRRSQLPILAVDGEHQLEVFTSSLLDSMETLKKQTPSTLTDENKESVKHLKTRKRVLFADVLKTLRQLGLRHNLGADTLSQQESIARILARVHSLPSHPDMEGLDSTRSYFLKATDLVSRARLAATGHAEDVTGAEITRSVGFLEGFLEVLIRQQDTLAASLENLARLEGRVELISHLWAPGIHTVEIESMEARHGATTLARVVRWLPSILDVVGRIVEMHGRLSKEDAPDLRRALDERRMEMNTLVESLDRLPSVPAETTSSLHRRWEEEATLAVTSLRAATSNWMEEYPLLAFILRQLTSWTVSLGVDSPERCHRNGHYSVSATEFDSHLISTCSSILVAVQQVQTTLSSLPTSANSPGWLIHTESQLSKSLAELHCPAIIKRLDETMSRFAQTDLSTSHAATLAAAVTAVNIPIMQQYTAIHRASVQRYVNHHRSTCKTAYILAKSFIHLASQGFCTPGEKQAKESGNDKLEAGTGLGDGEGAEDISKDIEADEDLDELAQEPVSEREKDQELDAEQDAVDMADGEMNGEMGEGEEKDEDEEDGKEENEGDDEGIDEETGSVDDLDPEAVDEKMWDGVKEDGVKEQEGKAGTGKKEDEQVAGKDQEEKKTEQKGEDDDEGTEEMDEDDDKERVEEEDGVAMEEREQNDMQGKEEEVLELPDDMELEGDNDTDAESDGMGEMSDIEQGEEKEDADLGGDAEEISGPDEDEAEAAAEPAEAGLPDDGEEGERTKDADPEADEEMEDGSVKDEGEVLRDQDGDAKTDAENAVASENTGAGDGQPDDEENIEEPSASSAQREEGSKGNPSAKQQASAATETGELGDQTDPEQGSAPDNEVRAQDPARNQAFKKLGDALERWHKTQRKIQQAADDREEMTEKHAKSDEAKTATEFEHVENEQDEGDTTQALGAATEEQAQALDESMGIDPESKEMPDDFYEEPETDAIDEEPQDVEMEDQPAAGSDQAQAEKQGEIGTRVGPTERQILDQDEQENMEEANSEVEDLEPPSSLLTETHLNAPSNPSTLSLTAARALYSQLTTQTYALSQHLTTQLLLILPPTLATSLRGDFRTGKRLNMKRILPYIASSYRRDKIWLRRSIPHKRSYQILLAVDDSSSMAEHGAGARALETLVMVSRALSMLEIGQLAILAFGRHTTIAHHFNQPFKPDNGPDLLRHFTFAQQQTDIRTLLTHSLDLFRTARSDPAVSSASSDLWQIMFIISDGLCEDRDHLRRLVRQAINERIMVVFLIVDNNTPVGSGSTATDGAAGDSTTTTTTKSISTMTSASFVPDGKGGFAIKMDRYLDGFPFPFYIIVRDVKELPGVLSGALRQWVGEVEGLQ